MDENTGEGRTFRAYNKALSRLENKGTDAIEVESDPTDVGNGGETSSFRRGGRLELSFSDVFEKKMRFSMGDPVTLHDVLL